MVDIIKVSGKSRSTAVAGAIAGVIRERKRADVQAIGAGAVNQAVKAIAIARGYLERDGLDITCIPTFVECGCGRGGAHSHQVRGGGAWHIHSRAAHANHRGSVTPVRLRCACSSDACFYQSPR
jgi:stage V sporulation protein S